MISNFVPFRKDTSNKIGVSSDVLPNKKEGDLYIALFQHFQETRCILRARSVIESHRDVRLVDMHLRVSGRLTSCFARSGAWLCLLGLSQQRTQQCKQNR